MATRLTNRTERLSALERALFGREEGLRAVELAALCGVDRRTIYRDLTLLMDYGLPINQHEGRFRLDRSQYRPSVRMSFQEAFALLQAAVFYARSSVHRNQFLGSAVDKLNGMFQVPITHYVGALRALWDPSELWQRQHSLFEQICRAWAEQSAIRLVYRCRELEDTQEVLCCIHFIDVSPNGMPIIVSYDGRQRRPLIVPLDQIEGVHLIEGECEIPSNLESHYAQYMRRLNSRSRRDRAQR